ncbi:MAG: cobalamin-binding protein [Actinobacteria bacterium]|nr:MAG: cobalamin-binding protein [Actinomycetota bacterium]
MDVKEELGGAIIAGKMSETAGITRAALDGGVEPAALMNEVLIPAMQTVGDKFERQEYFVPEVLVSARAMQASLAVLRPLLAAHGVEAVARIAIGTVKGDIHEIGKNIVCMVLEGAGFAVTDLGVDVLPQTFVEAAGGVDFIGMSSLMTTSRDVMGDTIRALAEAGLRDKVKVVVGGAAVTLDYASIIGADAYARDANEAVRIITAMA